MKKLHFIVFLVFVLAFVTCKKEEEDLPVTTVIEGRFLNHTTQLPIEGLTLHFSEEVEPKNSGDTWGWDLYKEDTDVNGVFSFTLTSENSYRDLIAIGPYYEPTILNHIWDNFHKDSVLIDGLWNTPNLYKYNGRGSKFFYGGLSVKEGQNYFIEIELVPK